MDKHIQIGEVKLYLTDHMQVIGRTGMGKSNLLELIATRSQPFTYIDPHGESASRLLSSVSDAVYFNTSDTAFPFQFNPMYGVPEHLRAALAGSIVNEFMLLFKDSWGHQLATVLLSSLLAVFYLPTPSLFHVYLMLSSDTFRQSTISIIKDRMLKHYWTHDFHGWADRLKEERTWSTKNKILEILLDPTLRNILVGRNQLDFSKNNIVNLEGMSTLHKKILASLIVGDVNIHPQPTVLIIDEAHYVNQNLLTEMLPTVRKWGVSLIIGHHYLSQFDTQTQAAILNSTGTLAAFQVHHDDAERLVKSTTLSARDLVQLDRHTAYVITRGQEQFVQVPRLAVREGGRTKRIADTRRNYCRAVLDVEREIAKELDAASVERTHKSFKTLPATKRMRRKLS
jgi:hypothetical protein